VSKTTIDSWLLRGKQQPDFEMRLAIYEELRLKRKEIECLQKRLGEAELRIDTDAKLIERSTLEKKNLGKQLQDVEMALNAESARLLKADAEIERLRNAIKEYIKASDAENPRVPTSIRRRVAFNELERALG
jgi:hypothetical protein